MSARSVTIQPSSVSGWGCKERFEYDGFLNPLWEDAKDKTQDQKMVKICQKTLRDINPFAGICRGWRWWLAEKAFHDTRTPTTTNQPISSSPPLAPSCCPATQRHSLPRPWLISGVPGLAYPQCLASSKQEGFPTPTTNHPSDLPSHNWGGRAPYHFDYIRRTRGHGMTLCNVKPILCIQCVLLLFEDHKKWLNVPFVPLACCTCCLFARRLWIEQWKQRLCTWIGGPCKPGALRCFVLQAKKCLTQSIIIIILNLEGLERPPVVPRCTSNWWDLAGDDAENVTERWHSIWANGPVSGN